MMGEQQGDDNDGGTGMCGQGAERRATHTHDVTTLQHTPCFCKGFLLFCKFH